ncbi:MAG TPA: zinc ribbon domain-containing protein [Pyrinomonadaceae bacterium]|nr:zinc ribbon domain-containing protein [Pyrinomonadaceae bacterium]
MFPEISRRCLSCGASVRPSARFCPQCGEEFGEAEQARTGEGDGARGASAPPNELPPPPPTREAEAPRFSAPPAREFHSFLQSVEGQPAGAAEPLTATTTPTPRPAAQQPPADAQPAGQQAGEGVRGRVARVKENIRPRVERMRDEALVVLEETPDDSGLRFIIIAAALFLVFLFFLFLSTTVLR